VTPAVPVTPAVDVCLFDHLIGAYASPDNAEIRYMVLPMRPAGSDGWSEEKLAGLVTCDAMIGTDIPKIKA
jgi:hypothetical protein